MSNQEKKSILVLLLSLLTTLVYGLIVYNGYKNGSYDTTNLLQFYARVILIFIPITIVLRIITEILYAIGSAISSEIKGEEMEEPDIMDERLQLIDLKTMRISLVFFAVGFVAALAFAAFGYSAHYFFLTILAFGVLSDIGETALKIHYHRRGV